MCIPTKEKERCCRETVKGENLSLEKQTAEENRTHHRRAQARDMQPGDRCVKKNEWNNQPCGPFPRQPRYCCQHPQQSSHDPHVQAGHGKKMQRSSLLKRFLDIFGCLMSKAERNSADKILDVWRILQTPAERRLHPTT